MRSAEANNEFDSSAPPVSARIEAMKRAIRRGMSREEAAEAYGFPPDYDPDNQTD